MGFNMVVEVTNSIMYAVGLGFDTSSEVNSSGLLFGAMS